MGLLSALELFLSSGGDESRNSRFWGGGEMDGRGQVDLPLPHFLDSAIQKELITND